MKKPIIDSEESGTMRVHHTFKKRIRDFILDFNEKHNVRISTEEATKIIDLKIESLGGLTVD